jgi:hypothetical protein
MRYLHALLRIVFADSCKNRKLKLWFLVEATLNVE